LRQTQQFSTSRMAETVKRALLEAPIKGPAQIWTDFRKVLQASQEPRSAFDTIAAVETPWTVEAMPPVLTGVSGDVSRWDPPSASVAPAPSVAPSFRGKLRNLRNRLFGAGEVIEQTMARQQRMEEALRAEISANFVLQRSYMQSYMSAVLNEIKQVGDTLSAEMQGSRSAVHQEAQATRNTVAAEMRALRAMLEPPPVKPFTETVTRLRPDVNQKIGASD
jgi:hypothetical protein